MVLLDASKFLYRPILIDLENFSFRTGSSQNLVFILHETPDIAGTSFCQDGALFFFRNPNKEAVGSRPGKQLAVFKRQETQHSEFAGLVILLDFTLFRHPEHQAFVPAPGIPGTTIF